MRGGLGRNGSIFLPLDNFSQTPLQSFLSGLSNAVAMAGETISGLWTRISDTVSSRFGSRGYEPVTTHYYDTGRPSLSSSPNARQSVELEWDDNDDAV